MTPPTPCGGAATSREAGAGSWSGSSSGCAAPDGWSAAAAALGAAPKTSAARTRRRWDVFPGAETHTAAGGLGRAVPGLRSLVVSARRWGGRAGAAGEEAGPGASPGQARLPSARRPLRSLS